MRQDGVAGCAARRGGPHSRARSRAREFRLSVSHLALMALVGSMPLAAVTPARADCPALPGGFCFNISGAAGSDGHGGNDYLGGDGQWGDYGSRGIVTLPSTELAREIWTSGVGGFSA